jgi:hypothetical protein
LANTQPTRGRPQDEHCFQIKYGSEFDVEHELWHDEFGLYTTLLLGINPSGGFFVAADPWLHRVTRFSKSIEFKDEQVEQLRRAGWYAWERERRPDKRPARDDEGPVQVLVGARWGATARGRHVCVVSRWPGAITPVEARAAISVACTP